MLKPDPGQCSPFIGDQEFAMQILPHDSLYQFHPGRYLWILFIQNRSRVPGTVILEKDAREFPLPFKPDPDAGFRSVIQAMFHGIRCQLIHDKSQMMCRIT
mgnify:CR=1 FL=1